MRVRIDVGRIVLPAQYGSRRERMALSENIGRELNRQLQPDATAADDRRQRSTPLVASQIAAAIAARLPPQSTQRRTGRHT
jgi:hypothetical protein